MPSMTARIIHLTIERPCQAVYAYASDPANMPAWASGLAAGLRPDGDEWVGDGGPIGEIRVRFTPQNDLGVLDHKVSLANGITVDNALRVVANGDGAEVMFTLLRQPDTTDDQFEADAAHVLKDLQTLKALLEQR